MSSFVKRVFTHSFESGEENSAVLEGKSTNSPINNQKKHSDLAHGKSPRSSVGFAAPDCAEGHGFNARRGLRARSHILLSNLAVPNSRTRPHVLSGLVTQGELAWRTQQTQWPKNWIGDVPIFWYVSTTFAMLGTEIKTPPSALQEITIEKINQQPRRSTYKAQIRKYQFWWWSINEHENVPKKTNTLTDWTCMHAGCSVVRPR